MTIASAIDSYQRRCPAVTSSVFYPIRDLFPFSSKPTLLFYDGFGEELESESLILGFASHYFVMSHPAVRGYFKSDDCK